ncbi:MAG: ATP-grasp domain-containing protein [Chloroflexi bacterium]|nr:ATP-grasp domain-containing protein [Chloroflexota bacterium]
MAPYDSLDGAVELARDCAVVTYELEHVDAALVDAVEAAGVPVRPGVHALRMTQDRLAERRFVASLGIATAPWREVADAAGLRRAASELGTPLRLKAPIGGYDGRSQVRIATPNDVTGALERLGRSTGTALLVERELDFALAVNELAPRVHNSGHWTIEGAGTSQFEQHVRAICGLPLGDPAAHGPAAMVNLLGAGEPREARLEGIEAALADPLVHLHVYDKRRVFERRKMGHLTVVGAPDVDEGLARGRAALASLRWS